MNESKLKANIYALREFIQNNGWEIVDEKEIQSGYQLTVADNITRVPVSFFYSGKVLIQGKPGDLQTKLKTSWNERKTSSVQPASADIISTFGEEPSNTPATNFAGNGRSN